MICTVDVDVQAANPDFPLKEWKAFKGSPTSIRIRNVPRKVGAWDITDVNVKCVYPDNTAHMVAAVLTGGVWVATIPASHAVGFVEGGYSIEADGTDERGNVVTGYRLGEGKVTIIDVAMSAHAVDGVEFMRVFDTKPDAPLKGDFALDVMEFYDGETWRGFSAPADYGTVRANAATGAAHAAETGNPHETTAEQVGVRVVEIVVEGDAKKLYLMSNGERTAERVTSYAALLAMAKRGLVRLYYNAVGGTGRKALYTPHMVDDNGTPAMRFDATGTLGERVYTRSIALTKSGADGIAVTIGALTEMVISSELAPFAKTAEVDDGLAKKRDKTDMFTEWVFDGYAGKGTLTLYYDYNNRLWGIRLDGKLVGVNSEEADNTIHIPYFDAAGIPIPGFDVEGITATRQRILTTDDVTTNLKNQTAGKAADAAAVARLLSGITAQDIEDFKKYKGEVAVIDGATIEAYASGDVCLYGGYIEFYEDVPIGFKVEDGMPYDPYSPTDGFKKLIYLFGSDNKHLGQTITGLAEAACADNPSASVASLEGRVVPCVSGASGTVDVSFAARKDGDTTLRFFDVLIKDVPSGGCQINLPPTESFIYGNALKAEEGWNHYSFAEFKDGDTYKWAVNRVKMSTSQS